MFEITLKIEAPELSHAILELASVLAMNVSTEAAKYELKHNIQVSATSAVPVDAQPVQAPVTNAQQFQTLAPTQPTFPPAPVHPVVSPLAAPVYAPQVQTAPAAVPTAATTYTMDQLALAATQLMDAGRQADLFGLLHGFGVPALTALPKEQYGAFATQLRAMGAKI